MGRLIAKMRRDPPEKPRSLPSTRGACKEQVDGKDQNVRATITDVSKVAGVSIKTVSRVLNGEAYVHKDTRAKVEKAIAELNFHPSAAARSLAGRRSFQIGLVCDNPSPFYVYEMQAGIHERCEASGVRMIAQPYDRASPRLLNDIVGLMETTHVDGLVLTPPVSDRQDVLDLLVARQQPFVRISPGLRLDASSSISIDNAASAMSMATHLITLGHRKIALVRGHPDYAVSRLREDGFRAGLAAAGIGLDPDLVEKGEFDFASGAAAGERLLGRVKGMAPSAVFAANDDMAAGVLAAAHRLGLKVPEDCSVAGFGDDALAGYVWPPLTTIRQPVRVMGWHAADLLLDSDKNPVVERRLDAPLVVRGSTGPFRL